MLPLLILAVIATPMLEIAVISQLLVWAPWPLVLALVVVGSATGLVAMRQDGLSGLQRWRTAHRRKSRADARTITDGLRDVAAILLAVPGVVTTVCGLVLLAHPLRAFVARRAVAADASRRRRRLPKIELDSMAALPPAPPVPALEPAAARDGGDAAWGAFALAHAPAAAGHIAGQGESHDAVVDTFFDPAPVTSEAPVAPRQPAIPMAPPLPAVLPPPPPPTASGDEADWGAFMEGSGWVDEPERGRRRGRSGKAAKRRGKGGKAGPAVEGR